MNHEKIAADIAANLLRERDALLRERDTLRAEVKRMRRCTVALHHARAYAEAWKALAKEQRIRLRMGRVEEDDDG